MRYLLLLISVLTFFAESNAQLDSLKKTVNLIKSLTGKEKKLIFTAGDTTHAAFRTILSALEKNKNISSIKTDLDKEGALITIHSRKTAINIWNEMPDAIKNRYALKDNLTKGVVYYIVGNNSISSTGDYGAGSNSNGTGMPTENSAGNSKNKTGGNKGNSGKGWDYKNPNLVTSYFPSQAMTDSINKLSSIYLKTPASIAVSRFFYPNKAENAGQQTAERLISYFQVAPLVKVYPEYVYYIPDGAQLLITGKIKEYYTSNTAYGRPKIEFEFELHPAANQRQLLLKHTIKKTGAIHSGKGKNEALEKLWHECIWEAVSYIIKNGGVWKDLAKATSSVEEIGGVELTSDERVLTPSQQEYNETMRERNHKENLGLTEYYNDPAMYQLYPKLAGDQYLEFKINGAKQVFRYDSKKLDENMSVSVKNNVWGVEGFEIKISSINITGDMKFKLFDPMFFKKTRRFYFGDSAIMNNKIPGEMHEVDFIANLFKEYKTDNLLNKKIPTRQFLIIASNKPGNAKSNSITRGYIDIIKYETGRYGELEFAFYFKTKAIRDASGKILQQPSTVEGRMRIRGSFKAPLSATE